MLAVQYDLADPDFPASLVELDEPTLPGPDWARVQVHAGGICGSDLHLFGANMGAAPTLMPLARAFPFVLGHEIGGTVVEAGPSCAVAVGTRVAVNPDINCVARGIEPVCRACAAGWLSSCHNASSGVVTPGMALGFTNGLGGGWAEQVVAHTSMLHLVPDRVPDAAVSLHEPLSIAVHGLLRDPPRDGDPVLVVGAAIIGLATIAAVRALFPASPVTVVARHHHQADAAAATGADRVVIDRPDRSHFEELAEASGARRSGRGDQSMLIGGFPYVVDAVGYPGTVNDSLRAVDNRGRVLLLGAASTGEYDLTPVWWKEASLVGAVRHSTDPGAGGGPSRHSIDRALEILADGMLPADIVITHEFPLDGLSRSRPQRARPTGQRRDQGRVPTSGPVGARAQRRRRTPAWGRSAAVVGTRRGRGVDHSVQHRAGRSHSQSHSRFVTESLPVDDQGVGVAARRRPQEADQGAGPAVPLARRSGVDHQDVVLPPPRHRHAARAPVVVDREQVRRRLETRHRLTDAIERDRDAHACSKRRRLDHSTPVARRP